MLMSADANCFQDILRVLHTLKVHKNDCVRVGFCACAFEQMAAVHIFWLIAAIIVEL